MMYSVLKSIHFWQRCILLTFQNCLASQLERVNFHHSLPTRTVLLVCFCIFILLQLYHLAGLQQTTKQHLHVNTRQRNTPRKLPKLILEKCEARRYEKDVGVDANQT